MLKEYTKLLSQKVINVSSLALLVDIEDHEYIFKCRDLIQITLSLLIELLKDQRRNALHSHFENHKALCHGIDGFERRDHEDEALMNVNIILMS